MSAEEIVDVVTVGKITAEAIEFWYLQAQAAFASAKQTKEKLEAAGRVNDEQAKKIDELKAELDRVNVWYNVAKTVEGENKILSDKLNQSDELLNRRRQQVEKLRERLREDGLKAYNQGLEIKRLKRRVNELIRGKSRRLAA